MAEANLDTIKSEDIPQSQFSSKKLFKCVTLNKNLEGNLTHPQSKGDKKIKVDRNGVSEGKFDQNSEEGEKKENLLEKTAENEKIVYPLPPALKKILDNNPDVFKELHSALKANANSKFELESFEKNPVQYLEDKDFSPIDHNTSEQTLLKTNVKEWKKLTDYFFAEYRCLVFSHEGFSVTYVLAPKSQAKLIISSIKKFFDKTHNDIRIGPQVMDFVKHNEKFSDLKPEVTSQDEIWIRHVKKARLGELEKELEKIVYQSYSIDENQYEMLYQVKKEILSDIENKFQVKSRIYQLHLVADIPKVFQRNPITNISCLKFDPENVPMDCLICVHWKVPKEKTKGKNLKNTLLDLPRNYHDIFLCKIANLQKKLNDIFKDDIFSHTIGISIPLEISDNLAKMIETILFAVEKLPNRNRPIYILLFVKTTKMQEEIVEILKTCEKSDTQPSPKPENEECTVEYVTGLIAEQKVDVIVNSSHDTLDLNIGAVSKSILEKAGSKLVTECNSKYPNGIKFPEIAITNGHDLPCRFVYHGSIPSNNNKPNIEILVESCLNIAIKANLTSIAFPVLGTGNLNYSPSNAAQQILSAIERVKQSVSKISLKKIVIVIHPTNKKYIDCFKTAATKQKGAIAKIKPESSPQKQAVKMIHEQLQWVQFYNYSTEMKPLESAIMEFDRQLNSIPLKVSSDETQELFFFYELSPLVPNIAEQLDLERDDLLVPKDSVDQLKKYQTELKNYHTMEFNIQSDMKLIHVEKFLIKIRQQYPRVKYDIDTSAQVVFFKALDMNDCKNAISQLEYYFGLKENMPISQNRSNSNKKTPSESNKSNTAASSTIKYEDICCFTHKNGLLIKIYQTDILDADAEGIVNVTDKWYTNSGKLAKRIIDVAGDDVNKEIQSKSQSFKNIVSTSAGNLKQYKNIIHVIEPDYSKSEYTCKKNILDAVFKSITEANEVGLSSIAIPFIGIFEVSFDICIESYYLAAEKFCTQNNSIGSLKEIHFVDITPTPFQEIKEYFSKKLPKNPKQVHENDMYQTKEKSSKRRKPEDM